MAARMAKKDCEYFADLQADSKTLFKGKQEAIRGNSSTMMPTAYKCHVGMIRQ